MPVVERYEGLGKRKKRDTQKYNKGKKDGA